MLVIVGKEKSQSGKIHIYASEVNMARRFLPMHASIVPGNFNSQCLFVVVKARVQYMCLYYS